MESLPGQISRHDRSAASRDQGGSHSCTEQCWQCGVESSTVLQRCAVGLVKSLVVQFSVVMYSVAQYYLVVVLCSAVQSCSLQYGALSP